MEINVALTSHLLVHILKELADVSDASPLALLEAADEHDMKILLASAWQSEGIELSPPLAYEVDLYRTRFDNHRKVFAELSSAVDHLEVVKGFQIGNLYPEGWVRESKDMDIHARDQHSIWQASEFLLARGWTVATLFVQRVAGTDNVIAVLKGDSLDPMFIRPEVIEMSSLAFTGNYFSLGPLSTGSFNGDLSQRVLDMLGVIEQRLERRLVGRDVVDAVVLLKDMNEGDLATLWRLVDRLSLWREWHQLAFVLDYLDLVPEDNLSPPRLKSRARKSMLRRRARSVSRAFMPSVLARAFLHKVASQEWDGSLAVAAAEIIPRIVPAERIHRAGLPLVGIPLDPKPVGEGVTTDVVDGRLIVRCPLGTFLAIYGHDYDLESLIDLRERLGLLGS